MPITKERLHELTQLGRILYDTLESIRAEALSRANTPDTSKDLLDFQESIETKLSALSPNVLALIVREETRWNLTHKDNERKKWNQKFIRQNLKIPKKRQLEISPRQNHIKDLNPQTSNTQSLNPLEYKSREERMKEASQIALSSIGDEEITRKAHKEITRDLEEFINTEITITRIEREKNEEIITTITKDENVLEELPEGEDLEL